jgi:hypothetical protein
MKVAFWVGFLCVQMIGWAATNSLDLVIAKLSDEDALTFTCGLFQPICMPSNAVPTEVAKQALKNDDWFAATNSTAVDVRQFHLRISPEFHAGDYKGFDSNALRQLQALYTGTNFTAVLFRTPLGERIAILQFMPLQNPRDRPGLWWSRVYDPNKFLNSRRQPNGK